MSALVEWLRDRRARAFEALASDRFEVAEADSREASEHIRVVDVADTSATSAIRQCVNRWCRGWFWDPSSNDRCACCRAMPGDTS